MGPDRLTQDEARERARLIADVEYSLTLELVAGAKTYAGDCTIQFGYDGSDPTFLDFTGSVIEAFIVNGIEREPGWKNHRIELGPDWLEPTNEIRVRYVNEYDHSGDGFHQFLSSGANRNL